MVLMIDTIQGGGLMRKMLFENIYSCISIIRRSCQYLSGEKYVHRFYNVCCYISISRMLWLEICTCVAIHDKDTSMKYVNCWVHVYPHLSVVWSFCKTIFSLSLFAEFIYVLSFVTEINRWAQGSFLTSNLQNSNFLVSRFKFLLIFSVMLYFIKILFFWLAEILISTVIPKKETSCSIQLSNVSENRVAFTVCFNSMKRTF